MENPFVYGEVVPAASFVDRVDELDRLVRDLGVRPEGLPDLAPAVRQVVAHPAGAARRQRGAAPSPPRSPSAATAPTSRSSRATRGRCSTMQTGWDKARSWLRDAIGAARPELRLEADSAGMMGVSVKFPTVRTDRDIVPPRRRRVRAARAASRRCGRRESSIALDEFQAIRGFNGGSVEHAVRAAVQHQRTVGYVFAGSEPSLMERMLGPKRPFYKAGPVMRLEKIPAGHLRRVHRVAVLEDRHQAGSRASAMAIVDLAGNMPYDVQRLAHESWDDVRAAGKRRIGVDDLHHTLHRLLAEHEMMFEAVWQRLTLAQRATLRAVVLAEGREMLSARPARPLSAGRRLDGAGSPAGARARRPHRARSAIATSVVDSLMREWIARKTF